MSYAYRVVTPPSVEPITLADTKAFLRVDFSDEDTIISSLITRARAMAEAVTHRALAPQKLELIYTIERPTGGELSGPIGGAPDWYHYQEQLGANPFGSAMFYFDLSCPPFDSTQPITIETRTTVWDDWTPFTSSLYTIDDVQEPARIYFQIPATANQWRFTYYAGYGPNTQPVPPDLLHALYALVAYWYENRLGGASIPPELLNLFLAHRVDWI